jgi:hypothetical protein
VNLSVTDNIGFITVFASIFLLGSCSGIEQVGRNEYIAKTSFGEGITYEEALANLDKQSARVCQDGTGYRKVHEYETTDAGRGLLVWRIVCVGLKKSNFRAPSPFPDATYGR